MLAQCCEYSTAQKNVYKLVACFKRGRASLHHEERTDQPSASQTDCHRAEVDALSKENRRITVNEIALTLSIISGSAFAIVHDDVGYPRVCARWVP
jgi:hypothetical protein